MKPTLLALLACSVAASTAACIDDTLDTGETAAALTFGGASKLDTAAYRPGIYAPIAGVDGTQYNVDAARLQQLGYSQLTLGSVRMPAGDTRFHSVFHKDRNVTGTYWLTGLTATDVAAHLAQRPGLGYRVIDLIARPTSSGNRFDALWIKETVRPQAAHGFDLTRAQLDAKIAEQKALGLRPIRIHGYPLGAGTRYSVVFVKDSLGTNFKVEVDETAAGYQTKFDTHTAAGFRSIDKAAYPLSGTVRYAGIFVADGSITAAMSHSDLSQSELAAKNVQYANLGYVMADVEYYSTSTTSNVPRYSGIWLQRADVNVKSNRNLAAHAVATWPVAARNALASLRSRIAAADGRVGFVVEDLTNGNYVGYSINDPFYMASTSKVMIAGAVLANFGADALDTTVEVTAEDLLELGEDDQPQAVGDYTIQELIDWMLADSSTNATDRLVRLVGATWLNEFVEVSGGVDLGEITSICELDRRIYERVNSCARTTLTCKELERATRNGQMPYPYAGSPPFPPNPPVYSQKYLCASDLVNSSTSGAYASYYATMANSITPLEYARVLRALLEADVILPEAERDVLATSMAQTNVVSLGLGGGTKTGGKYSVKSLVGYAIQNGLEDGTAEYSFVLFTEGWAGTDTDEDASLALMQALTTDATTMLSALRAAN